MDKPTFRQCLHYLEQAEKCMAKGEDSFHLARLSLVIEALKEAYRLPEPAPSIAPVTE